MSKNNPHFKALKRAISNDGDVRESGLVDKEAIIFDSLSQSELKNSVKKIKPVLKLRSKIKDLLEENNEKRVSFFKTSGFTININKVP